MAIKPEIKEKIKKEVEGKSLAHLTKEIRRTTRQKKKFEKQITKQTGEEKSETQEYIDLAREKAKLLLESITPEKIKNAPLASVSKAFRLILGQADVFNADKGKEPNQNINVNLNIDNLSTEEVVELLNKKSAGDEDE